MKNFSLISALCISTFCLPAQAQVPSLDARVNLNVVEQDLATIVGSIRDRSGANIVILEGGDNIVADLQITQVYWRDALEYAVELARCVLEEDKSGVLKITEPQRVNFDFPDADIVEIITTIGKVANANIMISPEVSGNLTVRLNDVPWRDALEEVAKTRGYTVVEERRGILRIVDPASLERLHVTRSYQLRYLRPPGNYVPMIKSDFISGSAKAPVGKVSEDFEVLPAISKALSASGELDFITSQNVIIVRDTTQVHETIQEILRRLDVEPAQVFIDVKFVTTTNSDVLNLGVDYGDAGPQVSISGGQIPIMLPFNLGSGGFEDKIIANDGGSGPFADAELNAGGTIIPDTVFGALSFRQAQATLKLLQRDTRSEVIQAPKLMAMDGKEATIFVGETIRYAEAKTEQGQAGGLQLSVVEARNSPVEVGFQLMVRPLVVPGTQRIMMEIIPKETSLAGTSGQTALSPSGFDIFTVGASGFEGSIALPRTRSSTMVTQLMLDSGQTAVIGGLTTDSDTEVDSRVPYLSAIPLLGELFKYKSETRERRSLVIFITPDIVYNANDTELLLQKELGRRKVRLSDEIESLVAGSDKEDE
ncbi:MAG: type IV pilus assembly protein PilQ [Planctomycetota bacterium]